MKRIFLLLFAIVSVAGMIAISGCNKNKTYIVTYDANGGTGTMEPQVFTDGEIQKLTPNAFTYEGHTFTNWASTPEGIGTIFYDGAAVMICISDITLYAQWKSNGVSPTPDTTPDPTIGTINGHIWVDLGLPSGTKWATCNVGAETAEGYGNYYAWGETTTKEIYNWSTYRYCNGEEQALNKYCYDSSYGNDGFTDTLAILEANDDAATVNWGTGWRMPTYDDLKELKNQCTITWSTVEGVDGYTFVGPNGNSIFLPAAGLYDDISINGDGSYGYYWTSSLDVMEGPWVAWELGFYSTNYLIGDGSRCIGFSVRPVVAQ